MFDEEQQRYTALSLFPEDRELPADALDSVQVRLSDSRRLLIASVIDPLHNGHGGPQRGSLQRVKQGCRYVWVAKYYDNRGRRRQITLGQAARMTKAEAAKRVDHMATINKDAAVEMSSCVPQTLSEFIVESFQRGRLNGR